MTPTTMTTNNGSAKPVLLADGGLGAKRHPYHQWSPDARALDLVGDKWTLLIVRDLAAGPRRLVELQRVLPGISSEQLRCRLHRMVVDGLVTRQRYRELPPRVEYELTSRARDLLQVIAALARWGQKWAWSAPRDSEHVDVGAILRLAPGLLRPAFDVTGVAALVVTDDDGRPCECYSLSLHAGAVTIGECETSASDVRIQGGLADWLDAFGPHGDRDGLQIDGDAPLAAIVLDGLAVPSSLRATA